MTGKPLRLAQPDDLPAPRVDADSAAVLAEAVETLAALRTPYWLGDSAAGLHALASLIAQAHTMLPDTVHAARDQATPGQKSASCSISPRQPQHADTGPLHDQLDKDHPHNGRGSCGRLPGGHRG